MTNQAGFTLLELLTSVAILTIVAGLSLPVYQSFVGRNDLDLSVQTVTSMIRRAETYARSGKTDTSWSVAIQSGVVTIFQGTSYVTRNTAYDETYDLPDSVTPSGLSEIQFSELKAAPNTTGTITLTSNTNDTRTLTLNAKGMVDY